MGARTPQSQQPANATCVMPTVISVAIATRMERWNDMILPYLNSPDEEADGSRRGLPTTLRTPCYGPIGGVIGAAGSDGPGPCGPRLCLSGGPWRRPPKVGSTITGGIG